MKKGRLFVISGPSGTGKGTICKMISGNEDVSLSVSMTTRGSRNDEIDGVSYHFVTRDHFLDVLEADGFLEHAEVYGELYGTPKKPVAEALAKGRDVILEIDIQGALKIKKSFPDGIFIFILPPSLEALKERLEKRGTESADSIRLRLSMTKEEVSYIDQYDYYVVNEDLNEAAGVVSAIMKAERSKVDDYTQKVVNRIIGKNISHI